jgi:lipopolysaccharide transport system ATP-binding protein
MQPSIKIENVGKRYQIGKRLNGNQNFQEQLKDLFLAPFQRLGRALKGEQLASSEDFWALKDVSFEVRAGEVVGIIGRNGAGKSTLLKILSRITQPTTGQITINGRVASLLEVGTGFHPELTGRENVYLNGSILGMRKTEIDAKFDEIVEFSGIEKFLDTPVKRYSSGMYVRLAFSVAAHLDPEVLIVDEVLAVGDAEFQKRSIGKMHSVSDSGKTVIFVSHNMSAIGSLCDTAILLGQGRILMNKSPSHSVVAEYISLGSTGSGFVDLREWRDDRSGNGPMKVTFVRLVNSDGETSNVIRHGDNLEFQIGISSERARHFHAGISIRTDVGQMLMHLTNYDNDNAPQVICGDSVLIVKMKSLPLNSGSYYVTVWLGEDQCLHDRLGNCIKFDVDASNAGQLRCLSPLIQSSDWTMRKDDAL